MQGGVKVPNKNISDDELQRNYVIPILRPSHTVDFTHSIKKDTIETHTYNIISECLGIVVQVAQCLPPLPN